MKISVVTVCYNEEKTIKQTIESVLSQTYLDYEYIIIDGNSADNTMTIVSNYLNNTHLTVLSEADNGLYDAMNKSLSLISGEYVIFMNSGDMFYDRNVLSEVAYNLDSDIVYGDVYRRTSEGGYFQQYKGTRIERFTMMMCGLAFCHQSQFTRTAVMRKYRFDETHKITADFDFVVRATKNKCTFKHVDKVICSFDNESGISAQKKNYLQMVIEDDASIKKNFPIWFYLTLIPKRVFRKIFR